MLASQTTQAAGQSSETELADFSIADFANVSVRRTTPPRARECVGAAGPEAEISAALGSSSILVASGRDSWGLLSWGGDDLHQHDRDPLRRRDSWRVAEVDLDLAGSRVTN
jgi:hypothetical protein